MTTPFSSQNFSQGASAAPIPAAMPSNPLPADPATSAPLASPSAPLHSTVPLPPVNTTTANAAPPLLLAHDLVMDYGATTQSQAGNVPLTASSHTLALNHVNFALGAGETVAVMGPSGSGKSTLLHALAGIIRLTAGSVQFRGVDLEQMPDAERTRLRRQAFGFVFQSGQLLPELPAVENIALPLMLNGMPYKKATDQAILWLEQFGLRALINHRPGEMSGGQMQRIAIARALCVNPAVIFADEPTGALDQTTGHEVMSLLMQSAQANHAAVVLVTHDQNVANYCSRTVHMQDGQIGQNNSRQNMYTNQNVQNSNGGSR